MNYGIFDIYFSVFFSMVFTRGPCSGSRASGPDRPGGTDDHIHEMIATEVATAVRGLIPEFIGSIKTSMIELFDDCYVALTEAATM